MNGALRVALIGAAGRMGRAVCAAAEQRQEVTIAAGVDVGETIEPAVAASEVVIDFSHSDATERNCAVCARMRKPLVIGTTGQSAEQLRAIQLAAAEIPIVLAANFSVGVNVLFWLTRQAAELLGREFDLEIVEAHHRLKKDAPSGTAKRLAEILCEVRRLDYEEHVAHGREGMLGERAADEIGVHAIRGGDVVGDHTVIFAGRGERLELTHKASSRETFAAGALRAAQWIVGKPAGRYSMEDVLGL
jgi:4-hydroxy-tetrahydrodipicolinate reductase